MNNQAIPVMTGNNGQRNMHHMHEQPVLSEYYGYITHNICHHTRIMSEICSREETLHQEYSLKYNKVYE